MQPETSKRVDFTRATELTDDVIDQVHDAFSYHPWDPDQIVRGQSVREALERAVAVIIQNVPPGPDRTTAIRKIREARMDANSAITHNGRY